MEGPKAEASFASYRVRRLDAEVLIDAINKINGTTDLYTSPIPEPFTYIPENKPAVALPDGSITSPFLALFGRPARATGMENERDHKPLAAQSLYLLNSSHIQRKIDQGPKLKALFASGRKTREIIDELYLTILSRFPTQEEAKNCRTVQQFQDPGQASQARRASGSGGEEARRLGGHRLVVDQQHRISISTLESIPEVNAMSEKRCLDNGTRISRREALQKSLYGTSGLLLGSRLGQCIWGRSAAGTGGESC